MSRRSAREVAMKIIFQNIVNENIEDIKLEPLSIIKEEYSISEKDMKFIDSIVSSYEENQKEIEAVIIDHAKGWEIDRIAKVDLTILYLAVCELKYHDDIPDKVTVNEAIDLAKKFGGDKSGSFINGLLANILVSLNKN